MRLAIRGAGQGLGASASSQLGTSEPSCVPAITRNGGFGKAMTRSLRPDGLGRVTGNVENVGADEILDARAHRRTIAIRPVRVRRSWHDDWLERPGRHVG